MYNIHNINKPLITEINKELNDKEYDLMIKEILNSVNKYSKATKGNYVMIENDYKLLNSGYKNFEEIIPIYLANKDNLNNFISDMKISIKKLEDIRGKYLKRISKYISELIVTINNNSENNNLNNNFDNNVEIGTDKFDEILYLIISLGKYSQIIEFFSQEQKEKYEEDLSFIINELKNKENDIYNQVQIFPLKEEINKMKNELIKKKRKILELESKNDKLYKIAKMNENKLNEKDNKILFLNENLKLIEQKSKVYIKENIKNKETINNLQETLLKNNYKNPINVKNNPINNKEIEDKIKEIKELKEKIINESKAKALIEKKYNELIIKIKNLENVNIEMKNMINENIKIINEKDNIIKEKDDKNKKYILKNEEQLKVIKENRIIIEQKEKELNEQREKYKIKIEE